MRTDRMNEKHVIAITLISLDLFHDILKCLEVVVPVANRLDYRPAFSSLDLVRAAAL